MHLDDRAILLAALLLLAPPLSAQTLDEARTLHAQGRLPEAAAAFQAAAQSAARTDPAAAATARNNACVVLDEMGDFAAALRECEAALRIRRVLRDPARIARTLNATGVTLRQMGDFDEAELRLREALELHRMTRDAEGQETDLLELAGVAAARGRFHHAFDLYGAASALAADHAMEPWAAAQLHLALAGQGTVLEQLGAPREAVARYQAALVDDAQLDPRRRAALRIGLGAVWRDLGEPEKALATLREAAAIATAAGDPAGLAGAWLQAGLVQHLALRQPRAAEAAYLAAAGFARRGGDRETEVEARFYLGRLLLESRRPDDAERAFSLALGLSRSGPPAGRWSALEGLGRVAVARGRNVEALAFFRQAMDEIDKAGGGPGGLGRLGGSGRAGRSSPGSGLFGEKRPVYAAAVELLARMHGRDPGAGHGEEALAVVQRAKVRELLDSLGASGRTVTALGTDDLRGSVGDGVLLEYFLGERNLYLWIVRGGGVTMVDLGPSAPILGDAIAVHAALAAGRGPDAARLARLSRTLLGPGRLGEGALAIAPDGALRYLPFELLADPAAPEEPLADRATSYLPAGSALGWPWQLEDFTAVYNVLAFGPPGAAREMTALTALLPGRRDLFIGPDATEANFRVSAFNGVGVIHFAARTVIDERPDHGATIHLAPEGEDDGLLHPEEIAGLDVRADLILLADCRTAAAPGTEDGGALAALTGSFQAAGAPAVLLTLWDVPEADRAAFLERLYRELGRGRRPAEALRRTRDRFRHDPRWRQSGRWAAWVLAGDSPGVAYSHRLRYLLGVALLAALALTPWLLDRGKPSPP